MKKTPAKDVVLFALITLLILELALRVMGYKPGVFQSYSEFEKVDSLYLFNNYAVNESGIYTFSSFVTDSARYIDKKSISDYFAKTTVDSPRYKPTEWGVDDLGTTLLAFEALSKDNFEASSSFEKFAIETLNKNEATAFDSLILSYLRHPYNSEGFRSISFTNRTYSDHPKILLLGDSFTYGQAASHLYNSFADLLLTMQYAVYNTGISGTDPAQYAKIVEVYLDKIKPDLVVVNFCLSNDFMPSPRTCDSDQPIEHLSNSGFLYSSPLGRFLTLDEAYNYYESFTKIPKNSLFNRAMASTAFTSKIWGLLYQQNWVKHEGIDEYNQWKHPGQEALMANTLPYIEFISQQCAKQNIPLLLVLLPDYSTMNDLGEIPLNPNLDLSSFEKFSYYYPSNFTAEDYPTNGDFHFNNAGSIKYAYFLDSLIQYSLQVSE